MKSLLFLLPLLGSLVSAQFLVSSSSVTSVTSLESKPCELKCPLVRCRTDDPGELCRCINNREVMCKRLCPKYHLSIRSCSGLSPSDPISVTPVPLPSPISVEFPSSVVTEIPEETLPPILSIPGPDGILTPTVPCECEQVFCIQSFPDSCYCAADNALKCFQKCGGVRPPPAKCPPRNSNNIVLFPDGPVKARSAAPEPQVAPEAELADPVPSIPLAPEPVGAPNIQVPDNAGATQIIPFVPIPLIGNAPPVLNFPPVPATAPATGTAGSAPVAAPVPIAAPVPVSPIVGPVRPRPRPLPISKPKPGCVCEQTICLQSFPASCRCENVAAMKCFYKCGGVRPVLAICPPQFTPIKISQPSRVRPVPIKSSKTPRPLPIAQDVRPHRSCGGFRVAGTPDCPKGYFCMDDPFRTGCGMACDAPGICVREADNFCGGFAGFPCKQAGKACVDDPRDTCDPTQGGADCGGVCVWEHKLT